MNKYAQTNRSEEINKKYQEFGWNTSGLDLNMYPDARC